MKEIYYYFLICIFIRFLIPLVVFFSINYKYLNVIYALIFTTISLGFIYQNVTKYRKKGAFNNKIWWDYLRPVHAINYMLSAYYVYNKDMKVIYLLVIDVLIGIIGFINNHYLLIF